MEPLYSLHVMPLLDGNIKELAEDAKMLIDNGICSKIACSMTIVPEGTPAVDKASILGERFLQFKAAYRGDPADIGILLQATIGHGWVPASRASFQKIIRSNGFEEYRMCPLDKDFQKYLDKQISSLASLHPDFFMVDDDFRLYTGHTGCFCPLHLAGFSAKEGKTYTRENLAELLVADENLAWRFDQFQQQGLLDLACLIRNAIDRHAPGTPCSYCICLEDAGYSAKVAEALAGQDGKKMIRINNARYMKGDMRTFAMRMYQGKAQIALTPPDALLLAETDTYPQNRWSTSAALLHSHYVGSILEGCRGAKHWITAMYKYSPASGAKYREYLKKYSGFYEELARNMKSARADFFLAAPLPEKPVWSNPFAPNVSCCAGSNFVNNLSVMGIPANFAQNSGALPVMLSGDDVMHFSDDELKKLAACGMLLDGTAALELTRRGLSELAGVYAEKWQDREVSCEKGEKCHFRSCNQYIHLTALDPANSSVVTKLFARRSQLDKEMEELAPGLILTVNEQNSRCAVFAASAYMHSFANFAWLDLDRKQQLLEVLKYVAGRDIPHVAGDHEVYLKAFKLQDGSGLFAFFNLGFDPMEEIPFVCPGKVRKVEKLLPDGSFQKIIFKNNVLQTPLMPAFPEIVKVYFER